MERENLIPYIVYESAAARAERTTKRLIAALIVAVVFIFASNGIWLWAWCQYDYTSETTDTVTVDGRDGTATYATGGGVVINGTDNTYNDKTPYTHAEGWIEGDAQEEVTS